MISRRGLRPRSHPQQAFPPEGDFTSRPAREATELLARVRRVVREALEAGRTWHPVLDQMRADGGEIWVALTPEARRRVVRHLRPYWNVHRFRAAPQIDAVLDRRLAAGSLEIRKAGLRAVEPLPNGLNDYFMDSTSNATWKPTMHAKSSASYQRAPLERNRRT